MKDLGPGTDLGGQFLAILECLGFRDLALAFLFLPLLF